MLKTPSPGINNIKKSAVAHYSMDDVEESEKRNLQDKADANRSNSVLLMQDRSSSDARLEKIPQQMNNMNDAMLTVPDQAVARNGLKIAVNEPNASGEHSKNQSS